MNVSNRTNVELSAAQLSSAANIVRTALESLPDPATQPMTADTVVTNAAAIAEIAQALHILAESVRWVTLTMVTHLPTQADLREQGMLASDRKAVDRLRNSARTALKPATTAAYILHGTDRTAQDLAHTLPRNPRRAE